MRRKPNSKVRRTSIHLEKNCLNVTSVDGAIVNLSQKKKKKKWIGLAAIFYSTVMTK